MCGNLFFEKLTLERESQKKEAYSKFEPYNKNTASHNQAITRGLNCTEYLTEHRVNT